MKRIAIYYRVSTDLQDFDSQKSVVNKWLEDKEYEYAEVFTDVGSGMKDNRPQYGAMIYAALAGEFDTIVVYKLDRFSRSAITAISTILDLEKAGCGFISVTQPALNLGEDNPFRRTMLAAFADVAQLERETIVARIKDGIQASLAQNPGKRWGGNWKVKWDKIEQAVHMREVEKKPWKKIASFLGCSRFHASRLIHAYKEGTLGKIQLIDHRVNKNIKELCYDEE